METEKKPDSIAVPNEPVDDLVPPDVDESAPSLEESESPAPGQRIHPLEPGGKRFEQIYARSKQAERDAQELRMKLAALEERVAAQSKPAEKTPDEYSWAQLDEFIQLGKITRADAEDYREKILLRKLAEKVKGEFTQETRQATREQTLTQTLQDYVAAVPAIATEGSADRERLDEEFEWLANVQGLDTTKIDSAQRKALQVTALRNVYGSIDALRTRSAPARPETHQGLPGGTRPVTTPNKDQALLNALSKAQVAHYTRALNSGQYAGWKDVVAELKYEPPKRGSR